MKKWLLVLALLLTYTVVINRAQEEDGGDDGAGAEGTDDSGSEAGGDVGGDGSEGSETEESETPTAPSSPTAPVAPVPPKAPVAPVAPIAPVPQRPVITAPVAPVNPTNALTPVVHSNKPVVLRVKFIREALRAHNRLRAMHGAPKLVHNPELSILAQKHARYLAFHSGVVNSNQLFHGERVGENIMTLNDISLVRYPGGYVTRKWYSQGVNYDYSRDHQPGTGLFTQIIWKNTREVGFGVRKTPDGRYYFVAMYYPAGNVLGQFSVNVQPPTSV